MSKREYSELTKLISELMLFVGDQFEQVNYKLDQKADKAEVSLLFAELREELDRKADTYFQEMQMLSAKVDRHEKWHQQTAQKLNMKLEY